MCYNISQRQKDRATIKNEFGASQLRFDAVPTYYHLSGFERGQVMIITEQEPEIIQLATWSVAPPNTNNIQDYWKKVGGGALNTRVESLFENKTPGWKREAILEQKCVVILDGMYKVSTTSQGEKIPIYVKRPDDSLFGVLGYYTEQTNFKSCSILTTNSDDYFGKFHKRMTFLFEPEYIDSYLDIKSEDDYKNLITHHKTTGMIDYPVSKDVINSHKLSNRIESTLPVNYSGLNTFF